MSVASPAEPPNNTNMTKQNIIGAIAVIALLLGGWAKLTPAQSVPVLSTSFGAVSNTNAPAANTTLVNGVLLPNPTVLDYVVSRVFLYADKAIGYGNSTATPILQQGARAAFTTSTTSILCAVQNPFTTATSTFEFGANIASTSANTGQLTVATSSNAFSTTSPVGVFTVGGNTFASFSTQGTTTSGSSGIVGPGGWITLGGSGTPTATQQYNGACNAIFTSLN